MDNALLRQLLDIGRQMAETRALAPLLVYAVDMAITLLKAETGYLILVNQDGTFDFRVHRAENGQDILSPETQVSRTVIYRALNTQKAFISANAVQDSISSTSINELQVRSVICVPLVAHDRALGVIYLENRNERGLFVEDDIDPLQYLASHAAVCIENALLYEELQSVAAQKHEEIDDTQKIPYMEDASLERERMRLIYRFIQDASHQFRTPLAVINTNADLLTRKLKDDSLHHYLRGIQGQVRGIVNLVDSLLTMVKLDSLNLGELQSFNLNRAVQEIYEVRHEAARHKRQNLNFDAGEESLFIAGDMDFVRQAIAQVVDNAILYTPNNGSIHLQLFRKEQDAILEIRDNGIGLSEEEQSAVFRRFYRGDAAGTTRGMGLGLAIVQKIMSLHHGRIELNSQLEQGTVFRLIFPCVDGEQ